MHGVKKDKSDAVREKERKQKDAKLKIYREGMSKIFERRKDNIQDWETLHCVSDVLHVNPDVSTLWNIRKEVLLHMMDEKSIEDPVKAGEGELRLTESCLKVNPKSYCAWHHRCWVLEHFPQLNLKLELALCNKYLKLDTRNFHCWDYRRFIARKLGLSSEEELSYTMQKIEEDFSNYSSWHYRSKLLPLIHADPGGIRPIKEEIHLQELDLVQNAAFTDPNDQSAWFYLRWLLGRLEPKLEVVSIFVSDDKLYVAFNRGAQLDEVKIEGAGISKWEIINSRKYGLLWVAAVSVTSKELELNIKIQGESESLTLNNSNHFSWFRAPQFDPDVSPKLKALLEEQLKSCDQLLELEPESKWPLLTSVVFMKAIDTSLYRNKILERLELLVKYDSYRSSYYLDMQSKYLMEEELKLRSQEETCSLKDLGLTSLYHTQYLAQIKSLNLTGNSFHVSLSQLGLLVNLESLILDRNSVTTLKTLPPLPKVTSFSIANNLIANADDFLPCLNKLPSVRKITLTNNPFIDDTTVSQSIVNKVKSLKPSVELIM